MKPTPKSTFALFIGNRGFFPASLLLAARNEMRALLEARGHKVLMLDEAATRHGAVETPAEGAKFAAFLKQHASEISGVILCLPNFGDETGAAAALQDANVPIWIQAYPDDLTKMAPELRRDAFCGKFSIMDVFYQYGIKFTATQPHVVAPATPAFEANLDYFDRLCRVVKGMRRLVVGAIGARTTAFKTVRIDELALQRHGVTMETIDLSELMARVAKLDDPAKAVQDKIAFLRSYTDCSAVPAKNMANLAKVGVVLEQLAAEYSLDCMAVRCWIEMQKQLQISPCVLLSALNSAGLATACEVDVGSAITMQALKLASGRVSTCLDWNNNFGEHENKCILFHCGPVPQEMMTAKGKVVDHAILANAVGPNCSFGCNVGRIAPAPITFGNLMTEDGRMKFYLGEGRFTDDQIPADFFGCAGVAEIPNLQQALHTIGIQGHRHHTAVTPAHVAAPVYEAFTKYLNYEVTRV